MEHGRTPIGRFVHSTWINLNIRCANGKYKCYDRNKETKNKCYENVYIKFSREEFKEWCYTNKDKILNLERPSLDRIDKSKDYSLDNIQVLELKDNIRKDHLKFKDGKCVCYVCKEEKDLELFTTDNRRVNGKKTICKKCDNLRYHIRKAKKLNIN